MDSDVLTILWSQLEEAKERYRKAKEQHREVFGGDDESPTAADFLHPDGGLFIRKVIAEERYARRHYFDAMTRLNGYLLAKIVPDDIQDLLRRKSKSAGRE